MDSTCQCILLPAQPWEARRSSHTLGQASAPDLNGQPHHGTLSEQSPYVQPVEPARIGPLRIPWVGSSYTEQPASVLGGCLLEELLYFRRISCFDLVLAQSSVLSSHNSKAEDRISSLHLTSVI